MDKRPSSAGRSFPFNNDQSPAFAQNHPVSFGIEGAGGLAGGPFLPGHPVQCSQSGEFQKMQMGEVVLASADDGGIDDAVLNHLDGAVQCNQ